MPKEKIITSTNSVQAIQDEIFRGMSATKRVKLTWDFSQHLMGLNKKCKNGIQRISRKNCGNFIRSKN